MFRLCYRENLFHIINQSFTASHFCDCCHTQRLSRNPRAETHLDGGVMSTFVLPLADIQYLISLSVREAQSYADCVVPCTQFQPLPSPCSCSHSTGTTHWLDPRLARYLKHSLLECSENGKHQGILTQGGLIPTSLGMRLWTVSPLCTQYCTEQNWYRVC